MSRRARRLFVFVVALAVGVVGAAIGLVLSHRAGASGRGQRTAAAARVTSPASSTVQSEGSVVAHRVSDVVALGDSVPAGSHCGCETYPALVAQRLAVQERHPVQVHNLAQPGLTTQGLLAQLGQPDTQRMLSAAGLVIVTVGANDLEGRAGSADCDPAGSTRCFDTPLAQLPGRYDQMLDRLHSLLRDPRARVVVTGYWNVFLDGAVARQRGQKYVQTSQELTAQVNSVVAWSATTHDSDYVDIGTPFSDVGDDTALLAADGDHPNALGHRVIAQAIAAEIGLAA